MLNFYKMFDYDTKKYYYINPLHISNYRYDTIIISQFNLEHNVTMSENKEIVIIQLVTNESMRVSKIDFEDMLNLGGLQEY